MPRIETSTASLVCIDDTPKPVLSSDIDHGSCNRNVLDAYAYRLEYRHVARDDFLHFAGIW